MAMIAGAEFGVLHQEQEIFIEASRERVWEAITDRIGEWWPKEYLISADAKSFALESTVYFSPGYLPASVMVSVT